MQGIMRKKYAIKETPKVKHQIVKVKASKHTVKKSYQKMKQSKSKIDVARLEVKKMQDNLRRRELRIKKTRASQGLQETLIEEMYQTPTYYDVKSISSISQANRIKKEIENVNRAYNTSNMKISRDLRLLNSFMKKDKAQLEERNKIIGKFFDEANSEMKYASRPDAMKYSVEEDVASLTGNPKRYFHKKDYERERKQLHSMGYDPLYKTKMYYNRVNIHKDYVIRNAIDQGMHQDDINKIHEIYELFNSMTMVQVQAFARVNTYDTAVLITSSDPKIIRTNYKNFINVISRIIRASEEI